LNKHQEKTILKIKAPEALFHLL